MRKNNIFILTFTLIGILFFTGCNRVNVSSDIQKNTEDVYKIAVIAPQFGPYEALGLSIIHGAELAVEEKNKNGGIDGKKIKLVKVDDGGLASEGLLKAQNLVSENVLGVIGHLNSDISVPASEVYAMAMIAEITPGSTNPLFTERTPVRGFVFRTVGRDDKQGEIAADYVLKNNFKRVAVIYNNRSYGQSLSSEFTKRIEASDVDVKIVLSAMYEVGSKDYSKEVNKIKSTMPDVIFFAGEYSDAGKLLKQIRIAAVNAKFLGGEAVFDQEFIDIAGNASNGSVVISLPQVSDKNFIESYKKSFEKELGAYSANSFDAANILISAIEKVREKNPDKIAKAVRETKDFDGLTGKITFDSKGDLTDPQFSVYEVKNGVFIVE
jgi:branched-chain amino acid transport system substrate-binding protein